ncbi:hypothetical protein PVL29_015003 [Vitis rotundifolia]|uniref:Uncharacterized protein n=1 Tax=Vitis rotundifolia TaxID=103349 RepID=A0AA38ZBF4_VITRO|nr:hypothetical protein PVL29_015003 [Vitis rotundifolia]
MAVAFEGFSIRDYVWRMRSVDVVKCWPFDGDGDGDGDESVLLPPMEVPKFRWWSHEVELLRSAAAQRKSSHIHQVESQKPDKSTEERRHNKAKARPPKKRSILEIFAVAPQIDSSADLEVGDDGDDDDDEAQVEGEDGDVGVIKEDEFDSPNGVAFKIKSKKSKNKNKKKKKKKKKSSLEEEVAVGIESKVNKNKSKKKAKKDEESIASKEKIQKLKLQTPVKFTEKANGSPSHKRCTKDIPNGVSMSKKKPSLKCLSAKKEKVAQTPKLIAEHQKPVLPLRGILKNQTKVRSGQNPTTCNMQGSSQVNPCIHQSGRHVTFSGKDDILGPRKKYFSSADCQKLHNVCDLLSDVGTPSTVLDQDMESEKEFAVEINESDDDVSLGIEKGNELPDICDHVDIQSFLRPHTSQEKAKHLSDKSLSLSQFASNGVNLHKSLSLSQIAPSGVDLHLFDQGNPPASSDTLYADVPRLLSSSKEHCSPILNSQVAGNVLMASNNSGKLIDHFGDPTPRISATRSIANVKALSHPLSSCVSVNENANGRLSFLPQSTTENHNSRALQYQPFSHLSSKELMDSLSSFPGSKHRALLFGEKCMDDDFFGLPLNSHGELIRLNSSGKDGLNHLKNPSTLSGSSCSLPFHHHVLPKCNGDNLSVREKHFVETLLLKDQLKLFPTQNYIEENLDVRFPSRLGITGSQVVGRTDAQWLGSERANNHYVPQLDSDPNLMKDTCHGCRQSDQIQYKKDNGKIHPREPSDQILMHTTQPTVRLMGKDVTIGRSSKDMQGLEDGKIWTDKEIITENCITSTALASSSAKAYFQQDWMLHAALSKSKESVAHTLETRRNQTSQRVLQMKAPESRFSHPYLNWQTNLVSQRHSNHSSSSLSFAPPPRSPAMLNRASNFHEPFISGNESLKVNSQIPVLSSSPHSTCQHMHLNSAELRYNQGLHATKSAFEFPFMHPDYREHGQPSWFPNPSKGLPPWLIHAAQQKKTSIASSQPYSDLDGKHRSCTVSQTNFITVPSVHQSPVLSYPYCPMKSQSQIQSSLGHSFVHSPLIPVLPGFKQTSSSNVNYRNRIKVKDRMKSKSFFVKDSDYSKNTKKRPAVEANESPKPPKLMTLEMREESSTVTGLNTVGNYSSEEQLNPVALELNSDRDQASSIGCMPSETQKDGLANSPGIDAAKLDGVTRSGPVKLSAGAKHILKPSQNMDHDSSRPTHSTIPFAVVTDSGRVSGPQKKTAKIYRF